MEWFSKCIELVRLPIRYAWGMFVVSGLLLFVPDRELERIHVLKIVHEYDTYIGLVFLISAVTAIIGFLAWAGRSIKTQSARKRHQKAIRSALLNLDRSEKAVLREFRLQRKNTILCPVNQQTVAGLMDKGILVVVGKYGEMSTAGMVFPVMIVEGLNVTSEMIDMPGGDASAQKIDFVTKNRPDFVPEIAAHHDLYHKSWWNRGGLN